MQSHPANNQKAFKRDQRALYVLRDGFLDEQKRKDLHRLIPADSPVETTRLIESQIRNGEAWLYDVFEDGEPIGFTVYTFVEGDGKELLSIASYAKGRGDVTAEVMPLLEGIAKSNNCKSIRLHTMRTGLVQKLIKADWFVSEIVMRKEIS